MTTKKRTPSAVNAAAASRTTKAPKKSRTLTAVSKLRQRLAAVERERDDYARELTRRVAKEVGDGDVDEDELFALLKKPSGISLASIARDIANDAEQ